MHTAVAYDVPQNKYGAQTNPYLGAGGESAYSATPTIGAPAKVACPPSGSNLQTLRKFPNVQSLQNLNLSNINNDSPRASYSSSSSSTTSSSSTLIIPEIFKQDAANPPPPLPQSPPPKQSDTGALQPLAYTQKPYGGYPPHPHTYQQLPPSALSAPPKYSNGNFYYHASLNSSADSSCSSPSQKTFPSDNQNFFPHKEMCSRNISPCNFQRFPPPYSHAASQSFTSASQSSINSSQTNPANVLNLVASPPCYGNMNRNYSLSSSTNNADSVHHRSTYTPPGPCNYPGAPDERRLSDPNSKRSFEPSPAHQPMNANTRPLNIAVRTTSERPGDQRLPAETSNMNNNNKKASPQVAPQNKHQSIQQNQTQQVLKKKQSQEYLENDDKKLDPQNLPPAVPPHQTSTTKNLNCANNNNNLHNNILTTSSNQISPNNNNSSSNVPLTAIKNSNVKCSSNNLKQARDVVQPASLNSPAKQQNKPQMQSIVASSQQLHSQKSQQQQMQPLHSSPQHLQQQILKTHRQGFTQDSSSASVSKSPPLHDTNQSLSSRDNGVAARDRATTGYTRQDFFSHKPHNYKNSNQDFKTSSDYPNKSVDYIDAESYSAKKPSYLNKPHDYQSKSQEYLNKPELPPSPCKSSQEYHGQVSEHPGKPYSYKSHIPRSSEAPNCNIKLLGSSATPLGTTGPTNAHRERIASPQRVTSPSGKQYDLPRLQTPPVKMTDSRMEYQCKTDAPVSTNVNSKRENGQVLPHCSDPSALYVQQYPERDNTKSQAPVWEAGYLLEKYSGGPYSPLPPIHPAARSEKAVDDQELNDFRLGGNSGSGSKDVLDLKCEAEKEGLEIRLKASHAKRVDGGGDQPSIPANKSVAKLSALSSVSDQIEVYNPGTTQHSHDSPAQCQSHGSSMSPETTDCGSLSKSSSDGDHNIMNRKRPPTKLKSKRRNLLSFPHHLSVDEVRLIQCRDDSYGGGGGSSSDDNRSSGHASMSDGHTSSSPPVDTLPRHHEHPMRSTLKSVPEDERLSAGVMAGGVSRPTAPGRRGHLPLKAARFRPGAGPGLLAKDDLSLTLESATGLEDIRLAIEQLTIRSQGSRTSYSTSTYSSMSGSEGESNRRLVRHSSLETINTNVTAADEFVWVDSHDRLVELQQLPWSNHDVLRVIQQGRVREQLDRVSIEAVPRLSYLLQRALVRVAREAQRLTKPLAMCSKQEISSAFKIVLSPALADSCIKSCLRAGAMYTVSGDHLKQAKAARAGLNLSVGRFMRWMCDVRVGKFIHEYAAVYLTAGLENLLEEMVLQCLPAEEDEMLTAALLEHAIANNADLWGLLQPYAHLNAGRTATGALCLPRWASSSSIDRAVSVSSGESSVAADACNTSADSSVSDSSATTPPAGTVPSSTSSAGTSYGASLPAAAGITSSVSCASGSGANDHNSRCSSSTTLTSEEHNRGGKTLEQSLLTTCVGSLAELSDLLYRVATHHHQTVHGASSTSARVVGASPAQHPNLGSSSSGAQLGPSRPGSSISNSSSGTKNIISWGPSALHALFYFMRCSQLEHAEHASRAPIQELVYERPYIALPPLVEWVRVATAHTEHRHSTVVDKDDVMQAARLLLPGVDCPVRTIGYEELMCPRRQLDELECAQKFKVDLAFKMLSCGRTELLPHALQLLPATKVNTVNEYGLTPLMLACIRGDEALVKLLLNANADVDAETPPTGPAYLMANPETQHWTALTYAAIHGHYSLAQTLLARGANVEGGATLSEEKCTETPLQVSVAAGHVDLVNLLLSCGANPYLSTLMKDSLCYSGAAQRGCYAAIAVAAAHGQRSLLHKLLAHPTLQSASAREVLSLEEILAEGASSHTNDREKRSRPSSTPQSSGINSGSVTMSSCGGTYIGDDPRIGGKGSINSSSSEISQGLKLTKQQVKTLQEAMYHSAESGHLEMTLDLRNLGVPWTLHCWMHTLATAHEHRLETIIDQLLQDFLQVWPDDYSAQFVDECLPLLFTIFRYSKNEGTSLLLADIFSSCFGKEAIKEVRDTSVSGGARIDIGFVNNPELSDVQFRVEGRVFYAHKIILVNASPRFKQMLSSKFCEGNPPIVQIHDIRYDIFELVMQSLYKGGCRNLAVEQGDVLELMAAANFFQLDSLLRYCEAKCSSQVHLHNVVSMYIHAKVYGAMQLLEYCQGFLLQNMVALLTYDDSVRRLIFGKKLHNHDVLAGLLTTLQSRIKARSFPRAGKN
ncbi:uncharacterized protein LOC108676527 isoform X2 [Hyalella azteca]|uniref:Uncharacterized protein LOC108676527 isoform X2 n=1 Tax=Hyalella azteca TaxID=294128 RepID=A0A8B7P259_HYAAZ|nr:uncharacterized protein LOC108676527 isoform X2 [Hyalella azteca]